MYQHNYLHLTFYIKIQCISNRTLCTKEQSKSILSIMFFIWLQLLDWPTCVALYKILLLVFKSIKIKLFPGIIKSIIKLYHKLAIYIYIFIMIFIIYQDTNKITVKIWTRVNCSLILHQHIIVPQPIFPKEFRIFGVNLNLNFYINSTNLYLQKD